MISYNELKKGVAIILDGQPYEIIETSPLFKGRGHSVLQTKLKNLITGNLISRTFHSSDALEEADISKFNAKFLYSHPDKKSSASNGASKNRYFFCEESNPQKRFDLAEEQISRTAKFLKPNQIVEGLNFEEEIINISLPIKINLKVKEAPPGIKGNRSEAGTKQVVLETGATLNTPLFVKEEDIIEINTQTGEYVRRIE